MNFVYAQTIGYVLTAAIAFFTVYFKTHHFTLKWNWPFSLMILKQSFPFAILVLLMTFYNRLDSVMLGLLLPEHIGSEQAGIYAKAFRLLEAGNMIAYLFSVQLIPVFSRMIKHKENVEHIVKLSFILLITPALVVSVGCFFYASELTSLINHGTIDSTSNFRILMLCFTAVSTTYIFGTLLTANGNLKQLNTMAIVGICINLVLNFILIPKYQAFGSAISSLATQFFTAGIQVYFAYKIFKFKVNVRLLIALFTFIVGIIAFNYLSKYATSNWMVNFAIACAACFAWAFISGLISVKSILRFIKYK
jgi:O-antigen/teichoic acid export membrane protein